MRCRCKTQTVFRPLPPQHRPRCCWVPGGRLCSGREECVGSAGKEGCPRTESYHESCDGSVCLLRSRHSSDTSSSLLGGGGGGKFKPPQDTQVTPVSDPGDPGGGPENAVSTLLRAAGISHPVKPETPVPLHLLRTGSPEAVCDAGRAQDIPREGSTGACGGQGAPRGPRSSLPAWPAPPVPVIPKERVD